MYEVCSENNGIFLSFAVRLPKKKYYVGLHAPEVWLRDFFLFPKIKRNCMEYVINKCMWTNKTFMLLTYQPALVSNARVNCNYVCNVQINFCNYANVDK